MPRDAAQIAESHALKQALDAFPSFSALEASSEWPALEARLERMLAGVRRTAPVGPPRPPRDVARLRAVHWNIEHGNRYEQIVSTLTHHPDLRDPDPVSYTHLTLPTN